MPSQPIPGSPFLNSLDSDQNTLRLAGGKAANLARLIRAGFQVPHGFVITTSAYELASSRFHLEEQIQKILASSFSKEAKKLDAASLQIQKLFSKVGVPGEISREIRSVYHRLGDRPVAIRSSATLEDLPGLSFAGQQDTYLNVCGLDAVLKAVVNCWGSLWTARAIEYRNRNHLPNSKLSLAVIVQTMVESESSGVLFSANPLTGLRSEIVIDATFGLGEALVSGKVTPDHHVVDGQTEKILSKEMGTKSVAIMGWKKGGTLQMNLERSAELLTWEHLSPEVQLCINFPVQKTARSKSDSPIPFREWQGESTYNRRLAGAVSYQAMFILSAINGIISHGLLHSGVSEPRKKNSFNFRVRLSNSF